MSATDATPGQPQHYYKLSCPCGTTLEGGTEDEIVDTSFAHLRAEHPDMASHYEREHILFMAVRLRR
jgi:hypothetical protein